MAFNVYRDCSLPFVGSQPSVFNLMYKGDGKEVTKEEMLRFGFGHIVFDSKRPASIYC